MSDAAISRTDHELQMLARLVDGAFGLSVAFNEAATAEPDLSMKLQLFDAFQRGSFAVRMGIRLRMALRATPKPGASATIGDDPSEFDKAEQEKPDSDPRPERAEGLERVERERDYEPVSLPRFLASLGVVAAESQRLKDHLPADVVAQTLPTLRDLLARAKADAPKTSASPSAGVNVLTRARPPAPKASFLGSASATPTRPAPPRGPALARPPPRRPR